MRVCNDYHQTTLDYIIYVEVEAYAGEGSAAAAASIAQLLLLLLLLLWPPNHAPLLPLILFLSKPAPACCPATALAIVNNTAHCGISTAFLSMAINGIVACTAANQAGLNFSVCSLHTPHGTLNPADVRTRASDLTERCFGRMFLTGLRAATAARILTMTGGHSKRAEEMRMPPKKSLMGHLPPPDDDDADDVEVDAEEVEEDAGG